MSSHLFRADILYDSQTDTSLALDENPGIEDFGGFTKHMKKDLRPIYTPVTGFTWRQTYVRQLVPRNRQLDRDLIQSCHFYARTREEDGGVENLILYVPLVCDAAEMPWYHPTVKQVAFLHSSTSTEAATAADDNGAAEQAGEVSVHFCLFENHPLDQRLERTALQLLDKIHKHSRGLQAGYVKRVHHDQIVPQQRFQETYARLKAQYAKTTIEQWVEETDPAKHVFEDLGIASFLIELWNDMYDCGKNRAASTTHSQYTAMAEPSCSTKPKFPGFVDIGTGNGLLVKLLNLEGYVGWGFDARARKTWQTFDKDIRAGVKEMVLVPEVLCDDDDDEEDTTAAANAAFHSGVFGNNDDGNPPFIISNHADELTPWTPLLAYLNDTSFIAIPCCSHNLSGARFRAPARKIEQPMDPDEDNKNQNNDTPIPIDGSVRIQQAAETGSLKKSPAAKSMPSAYASLCDYVTYLSEAVGYKVEKEMLRIPSTRNACLLGRRPTARRDDGGAEGTCRRNRVREMVAKELGMSLDVVRRDWVARARQLAGTKGVGH